MEWFANEAFWRELYPYVFPVERVAAAARQVTQILALSGVIGGAVLDLCCGPGRHAVEFARRGFAVTGVDRSPFLLDRARESAGAATVEWVQDDMREFRRPAGFDLACNLFTSFGYFEREEDNRRVLCNVLESLRDGGTFVMDLVGKERVVRQGLGAQRTEFADGSVLIQQPNVNQDWSRMHLEWTVVKGSQSRTYRFEHHLYSGQGLQDRLLSCGFAEVQLFGDLQGSPYGSDASRLVAVARKA
ncbi:MAG: class I SAM-dependent methyltransferase [Candidatus Solibacter sp.]|nr:class I SAM-dependent methyltransferase [Candidatus Solibacter sp.]